MQHIVKKHKCIPVWKASVKFDTFILFLFLLRLIEESMALTRNCVIVPILSQA